MKTPTIDRREFLQSLIYPGVGFNLPGGGPDDPRRSISA
jgi:hypothetical protein